MSKQFVIGDIHGAFKGLKQCLVRASFDYQNDHLICLGDVCDGWPETKQAIDELLKIKNLTFLLGNHDFWALQWGRNGTKSHIWLGQGGRNTINSYMGDPMPESHLKLLEEAKDHHIEKNKLYVHAGIELGESIEYQTQETFLWDRAFAKNVLDRHFGNSEEQLTEYDEIYIGHTPIHNFGIYEPLKSCEVWLMDTGAGWDGVLSIMNIETKEYFVSDRINELYPPGSGRM